MPTKTECSRPIPALALPIAAAVALLPAACRDNLSRVDSKVADVMALRADAMGESARAPTRTWDEPGPVGRRDPENSKTPPVVNPAADDLRFSARGEGDDYVQRLDSYSRRAIPTADDEGVMRLNLADCFRLAQRSAPDYLAAEEDYILSAISLLIERHQWDPRVFNDTSLSLDGSGSDGSFNSALRVINTLRATRRLPFGGEVEARWLVRATEQLREVVGDRYTQSSTLALSGRVPLLRGAGRVAEESLVQSERDMIYAARRFEQFRREFLVQIAADYFSLVESRSEIENRQRQLRSLERIEAQRQAEERAGRRAKFETSIASNDVLSAKADLASARENFGLLLDRFKVRLGIDVERPVALADLTFEVPRPDTTPEDAVRSALEYRLDLQTQRDRLDDQRRAVDNARNRLLPDLDLAGSVSVPTDPGESRGGLSFSPGDLAYDLSLTLGLPLDRESERLRLRESIVRHNRSVRDYERFRDDLVLGVRRALRDIDLAQFRLDISEQRVFINQRRREELELKRDEVDTQTILDAENSLLNAENARDRARTDLRNAVLQYLLLSGQLRVAPDGMFQPLPGMELAGGSPADVSDPPEAVTPAP